MLYVRKPFGAWDVTLRSPGLGAGLEDGLSLRSATGINTHGAVSYCAGNAEVHLCAGDLCPIPAPERDKGSHSQLLHSRDGARGVPRGLPSWADAGHPAALRQVGINQGRGGAVRLPIQLARGDFLPSYTKFHSPCYCYVTIAISIARMGSCTVISFSQLTLIQGLESHCSLLCKPQKGFLFKLPKKALFPHCLPAFVFQLCFVR